MTIVVLIILATISINIIFGQEGIVERARQAKQDTANSQAREDEILDEYNNKIDSYVTGDRGTTTKMCSPILLTTAKLPSSGSSTRAAGTYKASSSSYTKTDGETIEDYLEFEENVGWKVLKEGWYLFTTWSNNESTTSYGSNYTHFYLNNVSIGNMWTFGGTNGSDAYTSRKAGSMTMYISKDDVIDFSFVTGIAGNYSSADFYIYAMFK